LTGAKYPAFSTNYLTRTIKSRYAEGLSSMNMASDLLAKFYDKADSHGQIS